MSIDLSKFFFNDFCLSCDRKIDKIEFHKNYIALKRHQIDLIYNNLMRSFFVRDYNNAIYIIVWINNKIKISYVNTLLNKKKFEVLTSFKSFFNRIEHNMNKCTRIRIDNEIEYFNEDFMKYITERDIRFEFIIVDNS